MSCDFSMSDAWSWETYQNCKDNKSVKTKKSYNSQPLKTQPD
jgi:hypothetical protein